jgi:hypothetical protein
VASEFNPSASFSSVACSLLNPSIPVPRLQLIRPSSVAQPDSLQLMPIQAKKTPGELRTPGSWGGFGRGEAGGQRSSGDVDSSASFRVSSLWHDEYIVLLNLE